MKLKPTTISIVYNPKAVLFGEPSLDVITHVNYGKPDNVYSFFSKRWAVETAEMLTCINEKIMPIKTRLPNEQGEVNMTKWKVYDPRMVAYIVATGPEPTIDEHGDEHPNWFLTRCDANENYIMHTTYFTYDGLMKAATELADKLNVPLENEASEA